MSRNLKIKGYVKGLNLPSLLTVIEYDRITCKLVIKENSIKGELYFKDGMLIDAQMGEQTGEEVVYKLLLLTSPDIFLDYFDGRREKKINKSINQLLLESAKYIDESNRGKIHEEIKENNTLNKKEKEVNMAEKRSERISTALEKLLTSSTDIEGVAVVLTDGLVVDAKLPISKFDDTLLGATAAAMWALSQKSLKKLSKGDFNQALVKGEEGNLVITPVDKRTLLVCVTPKDANLGMMFVEIRELAGKLAEIMQKGG